MKKIIAAGLLICLLFTGCLSVYQVKAMAARAAEEEAANAYVPPSPTIRTVDFDALYRSHDPEEIVCTVNDEPVNRYPGRSTSIFTAAMPCRSKIRWQPIARLA